MSEGTLGGRAAEWHMNGGKHCEAEYAPLTRCIKLDPKCAVAHYSLGCVQHPYLVAVTGGIDMVLSASGMCRSR